MENTATRLKQIMWERNLRQSDILKLAEPYCQKYRIKLGKSDLSQFVNGKVEPGQSKLTILGLALNVSEAWLMGYDVPRERESEPTSIVGDELTEISQIFMSLTPDNRAKLLELSRLYLAAQRNSE
ncbi:MAG: transcriptional regulator [Oscillospiraceae bacterium]|nr:transcriptional regulator [Oscillospiraceae bacterium]